jgi:hypothetical protein
VTLDIKREEGNGRVQVKSAGQGTSRYTEDPSRFQRMAEALEMHLAGQTYPEIGAHFGVHSETARRWVLDARKQWPPGKESMEELRQRESAKLDRLEKKAWEIIADPPICFGANSAKIVYDPATGEPLRDVGKVLSAMEKLISISRRRSALFGLDEPVESKASLHVTSELDGQIAGYLTALSAAGQNDAIVTALIETYVERPRALAAPPVARWTPDADDGGQGEAREQTEDSRPTPGRRGR